MKNVYLLQNSNLSFDMDISKLYVPHKYTLHLIVNDFGLNKLKARKQTHFFKHIWTTDNFSFDHLKNIISKAQANNRMPLQIVTNAEEAITVSGQLRVFFEIDSQNFDRFKNKLLMKKLIDKKNLLIPNYVFFDKKLYKKDSFNYLRYLSEKLTFPFLAKPIDSMGSVGIKKLSSIKELKVWCQEAILSEDEFEIDEFIVGKVYNCDSFIKNNKVIFTQVSECSNSCYDFMCGLTKGTIALPHNSTTSKLLREYTLKVHEALVPPFGGVTHLEVIMDSNKKFFFVEIAHRSPGILIPAMYKKFLNVGPVEAHILLQIDDDFTLDYQYGPYCAWIAFPAKEGKLVNKYIPTIQSELRLEWMKEIGETMTHPINGHGYAGRALIWNEDFCKLKNDFEYLNSYHFYDVQSEKISSEQQCQKLN